jgi:hypothetical protein
MFSLTYVSSAVKPFSPRELRDLLEICVRNNRRLEVTGMLLYRDGKFMQVLEGEESVVKGVYEKLGRDPRHSGLVALLRGSVSDRNFPDWSMGFRDLGADLDNPEGYSEFLNVPLTDKLFRTDPSQAQKLLLSFKTCI